MILLILIGYGLIALLVARTVYFGIANRNPLMHFRTDPEVLGLSILVGLLWPVYSIFLIPVVLLGGLMLALSWIITGQQWKPWEGLMKR